jgi:hypothetical protein
MTTALASTQGQLAPLKSVDPKSVLERYLAEESTHQIAKSLGVTRSGLNYWLLKVAEDEWKSAQVVKALKRKEDAEEAIETAADALTLARARELLRAAQWDLERVCRRIYGQDAVPETGRIFHFTLSLDTNATQEKVIEAEVVDETKT